MDALGILILIIAAAGIFFGWRSGFIAQCGKFAALVAAVAACRLFGRRLAVWLVNANYSPGDSFSSATLWTVIAYLLIFLTVYIAVALLGSVLRKLVHALLTGFIDSLAGALLRLTVYMIFVSLALNLWLVLFPDSKARHNTVASWQMPVIHTSIITLAPDIIGSQATIDLLRSVTDPIKVADEENT